MEIIAVFLPLLAFLFVGAKVFFRKNISNDFAAFITCGCVIAAAFASCVLFFDIALAGGQAYTTHIVNWLSVGGVNISWAIKVDALSVTMMAVVNIISAAVHVYSIGYMKGDKSFARFMAYLSLFTFTMLALVSADNMLQLFFGWEGVGLASYLLIGFYNTKKSANDAAQKAFVMNRIGDLGLVLAICWMVLAFGSLNFKDIFSSLGDANTCTLAGIGILLLIGAAGKSAQLGLHTWLPDAMEGPTPVSALIHAATMVTAGVFLLARFSPLLEMSPIALTVIATLGAATAFVAATIALVQFDIKRVIAYSTMSQLGYMIMAIGAGAYGAAMFHLVTHAFFKALLFLGAGSVIHGIGGEQDMRRMGGLRKKMPWTYALMWVGALALAGIPPLAGYYSKDAILEAAFAGFPVAYFFGMAAAIMTAFYIARLMIMTFHGDYRGGENPHESSRLMTFPMAVLALGAIVSGALLAGKFLSHHNIWDGALIGAMPQAAHHVEMWVKILPTIAGAVGILIAFGLYRKGTELANKCAGTCSGIYRLLLNKWYFDEIYSNTFLLGARKLGALFAGKVDRGIIDRFGPDGAAHASLKGAGILSIFQSGVVSSYILYMAAALCAITAWVLAKAGGLL